MKGKINKKGFVDWDRIGLNILGGIIIVSFVAIMIVVLVAIMANYGNFEYRTFNGETGYSDHCYMSRGGLFCSSNNGYVQVESYKDIKGGEE